MNPFKRTRHFLLGLLTCLLLVGLYSPGFAYLIAPQPTAAPAEVMANLRQEAQTILQGAETTLLAQGMTMSNAYVAIMSEDNVVPNSPNTMARGAVGAALSGNRLVVRGSFRDLSSPMRDYASDPVNPPNPNITSAFHIHQGTPMENGPFQYALDVMPDASGRGGDAMGTYTLSDEQLQALMDGRLYVDIHTTDNRGGELRGILMPY